MRPDQIHYTIQFDVADGKMPEFERLAAKAVAIVKADEPGTIVYRWQIDATGASVQVHERFVDEAAMGVHLAGPVATEIFPAAMEISAVTRFDVHGDVSAESSTALTNFGAKIFRSWKGFDS
ncbi:MAG TPA: antibiotic biosynthesis monooxygenase [Polyangia bacterium]|nr:antibiotic biosynthesis monooxygenase [Polyangia bacterium]